MSPFKKGLLPLYLEMHLYRYDVEGYKVMIDLTSDKINNFNRIKAARILGLYYGRFPQAKQALFEMLPSLNNPWSEIEAVNALKNILDIQTSIGANR